MILDLFLGGRGSGSALQMVYGVVMILSVKVSLVTQHSNSRIRCDFNICLTESVEIKTIIGLGG